MPSVTTNLGTLQSFFKFILRVHSIRGIKLSSFLLSPPKNRLCAAEEIGGRKNLSHKGNKKMTRERAQELLILALAAEPQSLTARESVQLSEQ